MKSSVFALAAMAALGIPAAGQAQRVVADISINQGPVAGRVIVGDPVAYRPRPMVEPVFRPVVVYRAHRGYGWYGRHGYREVRVWYDPGRDCYYDHTVRYRPGFREVVVHERDGRYVRDGDWHRD